MLSENPVTDISPVEAKPSPEVNPLEGALRISPAKMQEFLKMMASRKGGHSEARALRAKARISKRKAKRK